MRLTLQILNGSLAGRQYILEQGFLMLGRGADCNLCFSSQADPGVSTHHALIQAEPDGFYLIDQNSTNGTLHNNNFISRVRLNNGDTIQLGNQGPSISVTIAAYSQPTLAQRQAASLQLQPHGLRQTVTNLGFYNPDKHRAVSTNETNYVGAVAALGLGLVMSFIVALLMVFSVGLVGAIVGAIMAFLPAPFYLLLFLWLDRYDPEPAWALAASFAWGGLFAVIVSFIVNTLFGTVAAAFVGGPAGNTLGAIISAPIIEEGSKGLGVVLAMIFLRREFDDVLDGIVYAGVIALGFATVENVLYYGRTFVSSGGIGLVFIVFLRGVLSPFAHTLFTSMTGIGCGIARESHNKAVKIVMPFIGYMFAVFLHGLWNTIASFAGVGGFLILYFIIWVPLFLIFLGVMIYLAKREAGLIREMLIVEVSRGLISQEHLELASSFFKRVQWLLSSLSDWKQFNARRRFLRAVTKLAFCYWHVARASAANNQTRSLPLIPQFQAEVLELRGQI